MKAFLGRWLHLEGRAVKAVQACLGLRLYLQLGHNYRWLDQSFRSTSVTEELRSFRLHVSTCAFQSYAQLLTQPSLKESRQLRLYLMKSGCNVVSRSHFDHFGLVEYEGNIAHALMG